LAKSLRSDARQGGLDVVAADGQSCGEEDSRVHQPGCLPSEPI
jgi:hypothetical protein